MQCPGASTESHRQKFCGEYAASLAAGSSGTLHHRSDDVSRHGHAILAGAGGGGAEGARVNIWL
jgi:hypothetical protein